MHFLKRPIKYIPIPGYSDTRATAGVRLSILYTNVGYYYPAAIYLATLYNVSNKPVGTAVRAIDSDVSSLIDQAAAAGDSGTNNGGGGTITITGPNIASNPAVLGIKLAPPAAVQAGAAWALSTESTYSLPNNNPTYFSVTTSNATFQFAPASGWNIPTNTSISISALQTLVITGTYTMTITWPQPGSITYGTALGASQLDATVIAITSGTTNTVYSPAAGTNLPAGTNNLTVTFTPSDSTNYGGPYSTNVSLVVTPALLNVTGSNTTWTVGQAFPYVTNYPLSNPVASDGITVSDTIGETPPGNYAIPIVPVLSDPNNRLTNYTVTSNNGVLTVIQPGQLVTNGGFEITNFSGWSLSNNAFTTGPGQDMFVGAFGALTNFYTNGAALYAANTLGYLYQELPTVAGQPYLLSLSGPQPGQYNSERICRNLEWRQTLR